MKEFNILDTVDMEQEWNNLCSMVCSEDYITKLEKEHSSSFENIELFDIVIKTLKYMTTKIDTSKSDFKTLFEPIITTDNTDILATVNIAKFILHYKQRDENPRILLLERLNSLFSKEHKSLTDFKSWLFDDVSISEKSKYLIMLLIDNHDYILEKYQEIINPLLKHNKEILKMIDPVLKHWQNSISKSWIERLFDEYKIEIRDEDSVVSIQMSFVLINSVSISYRENILFADCGCFIVELMSIRDQMKNYDDQLIFAAKQLSDKTKLEILKFCNEKQRYGTEIAEHLGISGATVSHHMNTLTDSRFVSVKLVKNRVYYSTNVEHIKSLLSLIDKVLN